MSAAPQGCSGCSQIDCAGRTLGPVPTSSAWRCALTFLAPLCCATAGAALAGPQPGPALAGACAGLALALLLLARLGKARSCP